MSEQTTTSSRWQALWRVPRTRLLFAVPAGGVLMLVVGVVLWIGFSTSLEATNNEEFCISCHEMRDNVYQEYKETIHNRNRTGVRATCPDCHVPRPWHYKIMRKVQASSEVYHKIMGTIDTREKFLAKRAVMAEREWARMKASDSRECRNCHDQRSMGSRCRTRAPARSTAPNGGSEPATPASTATRGLRTSCRKKPRRTTSRWRPASPGTGRRRVRRTRRGIRRACRPARARRRPSGRETAGHPGRAGR